MIIKPLESINPVQNSSLVEQQDDLYPITLSVIHPTDESGDFLRRKVKSGYDTPGNGLIGTIATNNQ